MFDGDPATPRKRAHPPPPNFWPTSVVAKRLMDEDATWYGSRTRPIHIVLDGVPALRKRGTAAPCFRSMSIVATVAHLSYCLALVILLYTSANVIRIKLLVTYLLT